MTDTAFADLERISDFTLDRELERASGDVALAAKVVDAILADPQRLGRAPFSYRLAEDRLDPSLREWVINYGGTGFVAMFKILDEARVSIIAIRHQREDGYAD